ncbi:MAG: SemiSWEET family transporter [Kofleriaceae bacterium]|nr:SemiSWEET family transporter [Kofleriaceae bacterium]
MSPEWVAYVAMVLSVSAFVPQTWKVISTRSTKALSAPMWVVEVLAFATWTTYGGLLRNWPILITNAICGTLAAVVLITKLVVERGHALAPTTSRPKPS